MFTVVQCLLQNPENADGLLELCHVIFWDNTAAGCQERPVEV